ncbi:MAG: dihydroorotase [Epulopiscium sp. Nele67-Bin001]|nr:MAG: dihydroorotase [Epulopiscium sp. Nuni2H_MBin001]OON91962.1 MAG: dihydroorotase [Epulopiscium sp. Nele67-Bin001]
MIRITNGLVINPATNLEEVTDVWVQGEKVVHIGPGNYPSRQVINASGKWVIPGIVDMHVHLREPGFEHKETIATGCLAAARGGITTMCCMPNTNPVIDNECIVEFINSMAKRANGVNVIPVGAITKGLVGDELANIGKMKEFGICGISEDGKTVMDSALMQKAMLYAKGLGLPVFSHAEDMTLIGGAMNAGENALKFGIKGLPRAAEEIIIARDMILAKYTGCHLHICHVSSRGGVELIEFGKSLGISITAETAPHYFTLDDSVLEDYDANKKMNPPLRTADDVIAIKEALQKGIIDAIATDHAPHHYDEKDQPIEDAPFGIIGLETSFALSYTHLFKTGILTAMQLVDKMSTTPAKILGIDKGSIAEGKIADLTIIDVDKQYEINSNDFVSKARNTPFNGMQVNGEVCYTFVKGNIVYKND